MTLYQMQAIVIGLTFIIYCIYLIWEYRDSQKQKGWRDGL